MTELQPLTTQDNEPSFTIPRRPLSTGTSGAQGKRGYNRVTEIPSGTTEEQPLKKPLASKSLWEYAWIFEISSLILSTIALSAIVITLAVHHDKPLPQWPRLISINALIAIFTVILKAALIMPVAEGISQLKWHWFRQHHSLIDLERLDSASRGPWGAFLLLLTSYRHYLAVLGAFITIAAIAIDPFSQQVVQYYDCLRPIPHSVARVPKTNNYTAFGTHTSVKDVTLDGAMAAALYIGVINPPVNASSSILVECPTGNCTFPEYNGATHMSLAMCSSCTDISDTIVQNKTHQKLNLNAFYMPPRDNNSAWSPWGPAIGGDLGADWLGTNVYVPSHNASYVSAFDALMFRYAANSDKSANVSTYEPFGINCEIHPCLNTYGANITNFVLQENILNSTRVSLSIQDYMFASESTLRVDGWHDCIGTAHPSGENQVPVLILPISSSAPLQYEYYPEDCVWNFDWHPTWGLRTYLADTLFSGSVNVSEIRTPSGAVGSPWLLNLFHNGTANLDTARAYMDGLANSMTAVIRQKGDTPETAWAQGTVYGSQTCIRVQWAWLSLPAALIVMAIAFLIMTIWRTRSWQMTWKSSALALLFHGLDAESRVRYGSLTELAHIQETAKNVQVKLGRPDDGWRFVAK